MNCKKKTNFEREEEVLRQEIKELNEEIESFMSFINRIKELSAINDFGESKTDLHVRNLQNKTSPSIIKKAYKETVMDLSHYDETYDEELRENMAHELGNDLLIAVEQSSCLHITLQRSLISAAINAAEQRNTFKTKIKKEQVYLDQFSNELCSVCEDINSLCNQLSNQLEFVTLQLIHDRLTRLFDRCEDLASDRQQQIRSRNSDSPLIDNGDIEYYLYSECNYTYPILSTIADLCEAIQETIQTTENLICTTSSEDVSLHPSQEQ